MKILLSVLLLVLSFSSFAFRVTPMVVEFDPSGRGATQTFQIDNNSDKEIPIEIEALTRKLDMNNKETREPTSDFVVYPMQVVVKPNEKRNIRVTWTGKVAPESELSYRLAIHQLPVDIEKKDSNKPETQIKFLFEYVASLYVKPKKTISPNLIVSSLKRVKDVAEVVVKNSGNVHVLFKQFSVFVSEKGGKKIEIPEKSLENYLSYNFLAGLELKLKLPLPKEVTGNDVTIEFKQKS